MARQSGKVLLTQEAITAVHEALVNIKRIKARGTTRLRGGAILTLLRDHDISCSIDSFSAQGWTAKLGDPTKGFYAQQARFRTLDAAAAWLLAEARRHYPDAIGADD